MKFHKFNFSTTTIGKVVKKFLALFLMILLSGSVLAQTHPVSGIVKDSKGEPLIGVTVQIKGGTGAGTATDANGKFSLDVPANSTLIFSYIGYAPQTVAATRNMVVSLQENAKKLDEVEIVAGYGTIKKPSLTGAISQIRGEEAFKDRAQSSTTVALQGEIPGLTVTRTSTRPGNEGAAIKVRGDISINGAAVPLVIIDGITASIDELNGMSANDIETISVLKDASAAIYGSRSGAGVVLVTTKRGKKGDAKITYNGLVSTSIPGIKAPVTDNFQWLDMFYGMKYEDSRATYPTLTDENDIKARIDWWIMAAGGLLAGTAADGTAYYGQSMWDALRSGKVLDLSGNGYSKRFDPNFSLRDYIYGNATSTKHSISISGGDDKFSYIASLGYSKAQSQIKITDDSETKYNGRLNVDYQASKRLKIETGIAYEKRNLSTPSTDVGAGYYDMWLWPVYSPSGNYYDTFSGNRNPVGGLMGGGRVKTWFTTTRFTGKATLDLSDLTKGLSVSGSGGYRTIGKNIQTLVQKVQYYDWADNPTGSRNSPGSLTEDINTWENKSFNGLVNYDKTISGVHHLTGMVGVTAEEENFKEVLGARNQGPLYAGSGLTDLNVFTSSTTNAANGGQSSLGLLSYLTRWNYSYANKYLFSFLGRRDGSSRLFSNQRWKNFYSISGGWVISEEKFMQNIPWLDFLKVYYNYGQTGGVDGIGNYEPYSVLGTGSSFFGVGSSLAAQPSVYIAGMTSNTRTWERIVKQNAAVNFALFHNRLAGSFDYFVNTNDGMFISVGYPAMLGATAPSTNDGKLRTKGWELELKWKDKIDRLTYFVGGQLSDASTVLQKLSNNNLTPNPGKNVSRIIGKPINSIYAYRTDGIFQSQAEVDDYYNKYYWVDAAHTGVKSGNVLPAYASSGANRLRPGATKVVDLNGDGAVTTADLYYAGDAAPHLVFGLKAGFEWNGFDVQAFFQGVGKQVVLRGGQMYAPISGSSYMNKSYFGKTWTEENTDAKYPVLSFNGSFNTFNYGNKDISVQNCQYVRLKNLVVGYTLPAKLASKLTVSKVRVYFSGDDLWELTSVKDGFDPEYGEASNSTLPFTRLLSVGLDVTF